MANKNNKSNSPKADQSSEYYAPVVALLGHVDHGKTSLLDAILKKELVKKEHGGITQRIGASGVEVTYEKKKRKITFIDTPGHEAFSQMRGRGTQAADIGLLVISSEDGVMPQTKESINLLLQAKIPFIAVLTKADLPDKNPEKVKQQLLKEGVLLEEYGGEVPAIEVSAKTNINIKQLLDLILLVHDMRKTSNVSEKNPLKAIIIESKLDNKSGPKATVVVKDGLLKLKDEIISDGIKGKVKTLINEKRELLNKAVIGDAVEILGFEKVPAVGSLVSNTDFGSPQLNKTIVDNTKQDKNIPSETPSGFFEQEKPPLSVIICADVEGSLEAIVHALPKEIKVYLQKTGEITPADILLAKSTGSIVLGFNVKISPNIAKFALSEKVLIKNYDIIYSLIDEVKDVLEGKLAKVLEEVFGKAQILASFPYEKTKVLGIKILEGRIAKGDKVRLLRKNEVIGESVVNSVRQGKNTVSKIEKGGEAGVLLSPFLDFNIGDVLICHS